MRRTDLQDTNLEVHRVRVELMRKKTPEWRIQKVFELMELSRTAFPEQTKLAIKKAMMRP